MHRPSIQTTHRCLGPPATCRGFVYRTVGWRVPVACCAVWLLRTQVSAVVRCLLLPWVQSAQTLLCSLPFTPFLADTFTRAFSLPYFVSRLLLLALTAPTGSPFISMQCSQEVRVFVVLFGFARHRLTLSMRAALCRFGVCAVSTMFRRGLSAFHE